MSMMYAAQQEVIDALLPGSVIPIWLTVWNAVRQHGAHGAAAMVGRVTHVDLPRVSGADDR